MSGSSCGQRQRWARAYRDDPTFFGEGPSGFARRAIERFEAGGAKTILELGFGQGRDTLLFAERGFRVTALDYEAGAVEAFEAVARDREVGDGLELGVHDVREPLPFDDGSFDAAYAHMLLCMELTEPEIDFALGELHRVVRPGGFVAYSVRSDHDPHYRRGTPVGPDLYEVGGFVVHFFDEPKIRRLARGFDLVSLERHEEGSLPRDLYEVTLRRQPGARPARKETPMTPTEPTVDERTRTLMHLAAALAGDCEPCAAEAVGTARAAGATEEELEAAADAAAQVKAEKVRLLFAKIRGAPPGAT